MSLFRPVEIDEPAALAAGCAAVFVLETPESCLLEELPRKLELLDYCGVLAAG